MADWKRGVQRFLHRVEEKIDEQREKQRFFAGSGDARVEPYRGFGCPDRAWVRGRVLRGLPLPPAKETDSRLMNLAAMVQRFESDEVPGARVRVRFAGGEHVVTADEEGYWECWMEPRPPFKEGVLWHEVEAALADTDGAAPVKCHILVPPAEAEFGVISDLDDTVVRSDVTSKLRMFRTIFLKNARTRMPFTGVAAFYRALQRGSGASDFNPVFYVSSSPWNIYDLLTEFLTLQKIPLGPLMLRDWGLGPGESLPGGGHQSHKSAQIRRILDLFPALPFILIGDSGQEDPEIYHRTVHDYPDRIRAVYIRNINARPERIFSIQKLAEEVKRAGSSLVLCDDTLTAARHAADHGWIQAKAVDEVRAEVLQSDALPATPAAEELNREMSTDGDAV
jgi:phosphatidate phosphatase APP1